MLLHNTYLLLAVIVPASALLTLPILNTVQLSTLFLTPHAAEVILLAVGGAV
jgi:hypothetical protein